MRVPAAGLISVPVRAVCPNGQASSMETCRDCEGEMLDFLLLVAAVVVTSRGGRSRRVRLWERVVGLLGLEQWGRVCTYSWK